MTNWEKYFQLIFPTYTMKVNFCEIKRTHRIKKKRFQHIEQWAKGYEYVSHREGNISDFKYSTLPHNNRNDI
jgi:hypothetical protein